MGFPRVPMRFPRVPMRPLRVPWASMDYVAGTQPNVQYAQNIATVPGRWWGYCALSLLCTFVHAFDSILYLLACFAFRIKLQM